MAYGGLDFQSLRAELDAARQERTVLLQQAAALDYAEGHAALQEAIPALVADTLRQEMQPCATASAAMPDMDVSSAAPRLPQRPKKLSWGTQRSPSPGTSTSHQQVPVHLPQVPANAGGATLPVASPQQQPSTVESNNATIAGGALSAATSYSAVAQVPGSCTLDSTPRQVASPLNQQQQQQVGAALAGYDSSSSGRAMGPHVPLVYAEHALGISSSYANHVSASAAGPSTGALGTGQVLSAAAAAEGAAAAFGPGRAVVEAAARRTALRDVLSAILGDVGPKLDHYRLDVQSIAAVVRQRESAAAEAGRKELEAAAVKEANACAAKAAKAAEEKAARSQADVRKGLEAERASLREQLAKLQSQVAALEKERKTLAGKAAQQGRDARGTGEAVQALQAQVTTLQTSLDAKSKATLRVQSELDKARTALAQQRSEHEALQSELGAVRAELAAAQQAAVSAAAASAANKARACALAEQRKGEMQLLRGVHEQECLHLQAQLCAAKEAADAQYAALSTALDEVSSMLAHTISSTQGSVGELQQGVIQMQDDAKAMHTTLSSELASLREECYAYVGSFHEHARSAASTLSSQVTALAAASALLQELGPEGLLALQTEAVQLREQATALLEQQVKAASDASYASAALSRARAEAAMKDGELRMMAADQAALAKELAAAREESARNAAEAARHARSVAELHVTLADARAAAQAASMQMEAAVQRAEEEEARVLALRDELQAAAHALAAAQGAAVGAGAAGRHAAYGSAAELVEGLRNKYFSMLPSHPSTTNHQASHVSSIKAPAHTLTTNTAGMTGSSSSSSSVVKAGGQGGLPPRSRTPSAAAPAAGVAASSSSALLSQPAECADEEDDAGCGAELAGCAELESAVGIRICPLSHEAIMEAFDTYISRQADLAQSMTNNDLGGTPTAAGFQGGALPQAAAVQQGERSCQEEASQYVQTQMPMRGGSLQIVQGLAGVANSQGALSASEGVQSDVSMCSAERGLARELLWLEGCLLVLVLELRFAGRRVVAAEEQAQAQAQARTASPSRPSSSSAHHLANTYSTAATIQSHTAPHSSERVRGLVAQMLQSMAAEKKSLQRRVRALEQGVGTILAGSSSSSRSSMSTAPYIRQPRSSYASSLAQSVMVTPRSSTAGASLGVNNSSGAPASSAPSVRRGSGTGSRQNRWSTGAGSQSCEGEDSAGTDAATSVGWLPRPGWAATDPVQGTVAYGSGREGVSDAHGSNAWPQAVVQGTLLPPTTASAAAGATDGVQAEADMHHGQELPDTAYMSAAGAAAQGQQHTFPGPHMQLQSQSQSPEQAPYSHAQADADELDEVLSVLGESGLRRSRGFAGLTRGSPCHGQGLHYPAGALSRPPTTAWGKGSPGSRSTSASASAAGSRLTPTKVSSTGRAGSGHASSRAPAAAALPLNSPLYNGPGGYGYLPTQGGSAAGRSLGRAVSWTGEGGHRNAGGGGVGLAAPARGGMPVRESPRRYSGPGAVGMTPDQSS